MSDARGRRHAASRRRVLDAAWGLSRSQGLTGWSLRELAGQLDMRAPSLYVYFDAKSAIYDAMFADGYRQLLEVIDEAHGGASDPAALLREIAALYLEFCRRDPARFQLLFLRVVPGFVPSAGAYAMATSVFDRLAAELAGVGITDVGSADMWTALLTGMASQQISNDPGGTRWLGLVERAVSMYLASELPTQQPGRPDRRARGG